MTHNKLSAEVVDYVRDLRAAEPGWTTVACVQAVQEKFGITIHRRSLERAIASKKNRANSKAKKLRLISPGKSLGWKADFEEPRI